MSEWLRRLSKAKSAGTRVAKAGNGAPKNQLKQLTRKLTGSFGIREMQSAQNSFSAESAKILHF
jgi:hypothetical protein